MVLPGWQELPWEAEGERAGPEKGDGNVTLLTLPGSQMLAVESITQGLSHSLSPNTFLNFGLSQGLTPPVLVAPLSTPHLFSSEHLMAKPTAKKLFTVSFFKKIFFVGI